jgi:phosphatidylserine/phosphatidylglycerophosphate/cardiolipin synthase-like enzyme
MISGCFAKPFLPATFALIIFFAWSPRASFAAAPKQASLDEWRSLTSPTAPPPRVFVKGDEIRFYFQGDPGVAEFGAHWRRLRVPTEGFRVNFALLRWHQKLPRMPEGQRGWREAKVIAGAEWNRLTTNLLAVLTPSTPLHGFYYQGFLADRLLYRDAQGTPCSVALGEQPREVVIDRRYSIEETLELMARLFEEDLSRNYPGKSLFLLMAPNTRRFTQPMLLDRRQRQCVWLSPAALYDTTERGLGISATAQGISALLFEGHGLALLKNPVSSVARLGDVGIQTVVRVLRFPFLKPSNQFPEITNRSGMDLDAWESWLDRNTGTRRKNGSIDLLLDGERFFPRLRQAIAEATNHIHFEVYMFDKDDVAVGIADELKRRSKDIPVDVILDRVGSIAAGVSPPATPLPEDFVPPSSIRSYLQQDSRVRIHPFLNPWFSSDHTKVYLVDGTYAWLGGMNLGREYRYEWHDLMVELKGPVVTTLETEFRRHWTHASLLGDLGYIAAVVSEPKTPKPVPDAARWSQLRLLPTRTAWKPFSAAVLGAIRRSQNYIYIENPYLFDKDVIGNLVRARNRGVDVRVILPRVNDLKAGGRSNLVTANYLLQHGVRVYFYPGMTHVKALLVDGWACVGSANLSHLSLGLCQEQNIGTSDAAFAARLKTELFEEDFSRSYELTEPIAVDWVDFLTDQMLVDF